MCTVLAGLAVWAIVLLAASITEMEAIVSFMPLLVLAATYETSFFIHTGVERVGRYLQVFYEEAAGTPLWETTAMNYGASFKGGADPLFGALFHIAIATNFVVSVATLERNAPVIALLLAAHLCAAYRIVVTKRAASTQRALDLERFRNLVSR